MPSRGRVFVGLFAAKVLTLVGILAVVIGLVLIVIGIPATWLVTSGALLSVLSFAALYLLARWMQPKLDLMAEVGLTTIYMPLLNEGTEVWRPVGAMKIADLGYMVTEPAPTEEEWAFQPGHILRCEEQPLRDGIHLVAVAKAT